MHIPSQNELLSVRGLRYNYGTRAVLDGLDFSVMDEEIVGLLGPNGSGKSTLFRLLSGIYPLQAGSIDFSGERVAETGACVSKNLRAKMGVVFQDASVDPSLSSRRNLALAAELYGLSGEVLNTRLEAGLERAGLLERANDKVKTFSGGMRRKLELVRAMLHQPKFLLMDEPSTGLDEEGFRSFWHFCEHLRAQAKTSILLATHRSDEAARCDRLLVIHKGKIIANESPENLCARVSGDRVVLKLADESDVEKENNIMTTLKRNFPELMFEADSSEIHVVVEQGHALVPRLIESLPNNTVQSVYVRRPTLADAYLQITGGAKL